MQLEWVFIFVLLRVYLPPEFLTKAFRAAADAFEIVEIIGRNPLQYLAHATHGEHRKSVMRSRVIQMAAEELHQLAALSGFGFLLCGEVFRKVITYGTHLVSVPTLRGKAKRNTAPGRLAKS